jgi:hypothetical protein
MAKPDRQTLIHAFREAAAAALDADPGEGQDGGTCNFDSPAIHLPGIPAKFVEECAHEAGIRAADFKWLGGKRWFWILLPTRGQANRRTIMAEAGCRRLKQLGFDAEMYMQAD